MHTCNLSTWEGESRGSGVEGQPGLPKTLSQKQTNTIVHSDIRSVTSPKDAEALQSNSRVFTKDFWHQSF